MQTGQIASMATLRSLTKSSGFSIPTETRIVFSVIPASRRASSVIEAWLIVSGYSINDSTLIVAVYVWGGWQQRRYRRKFGATFKANHAADALYQQSRDRKSVV